MKSIKGINRAPYKNTVYLLHQINNLYDVRCLNTTKHGFRYITLKRAISKEEAQLWCDMHNYRILSTSDWHIFMRDQLNE